MNDPLPTRFPSVIQPRQALALALAATGADASIFDRTKFGTRLRGSCGPNGRRYVGRIALARWRVWTHMRALGLSYPEIGRETGTAHSSVIEGIKRYRSLIHQNGSNLSTGVDKANVAHV